MLADADAVLARRPGFVGDLKIGVVRPHAPGSPFAYEMRAFLPKDGATVEDPVTGSLNASIAQWQLRSGRTTAPYVVSQGTALGRAGRVHVTRDGGDRDRSDRDSTDRDSTDRDSTDRDRDIWIGGGTVTCISGTVEL